MKAGSVWELCLFLARLGEDLLSWLCVFLSCLFERLLCYSIASFCPALAKACSDGCASSYPAFIEACSVRAMRLLALPLSESCCLRTVRSSCLALAKACAVNAPPPPTSAILYAYPFCALQLLRKCLLCQTPRVRDASIPFFSSLWLAGNSMTWITCTGRCLRQHLKQNILL